MTTFMPAAEDARAMPRPMPLEPPVMNATFPFTSASGVTCGALAAAEPGAAGAAEPALPVPAPAAVIATALPTRKPRRDTCTDDSSLPMTDLSLLGWSAGGFQ